MSRYGADILGLESARSTAANQDPSLTLAELITSTRLALFLSGLFTIHTFKLILIDLF